MKHRIARHSLASIASLALLVALGAPAGAADVVPTPLPVPEPVVQTPSSAEAVNETATVSVSQLPLATLQTNGAAAISKRQITLAGITAKLSAQTKDCGVRGVMQSEIARTSTSLATLGVALASTTDVAAARIFYRQIFTEHRVYALVGPKAGVVERCAVQLNRSDVLAAEAVRLQGLIDKAKAEGIDTTVAQVAKDSAVATLSTVNPIPSQSTVIYLVPDRGDKTLLAANNSALTAATAQLNASLLQQRTVNAQLDAVRAALRQDIKIDNAQDKATAKLAAEAKRAAAAAEREAKRAAAAAARETRRVGVTTTRPSTAAVVPAATPTSSVPAV
jgi:hypothetical protein